MQWCGFIFLVLQGLLVSFFFFTEICLNGSCLRANEVFKMCCTLCPCTCNLFYKLHLHFRTWICRYCFMHSDNELSYAVITKYIMYFVPCIVMVRYMCNKTSTCRRSLLTFQVYGWFVWTRYLQLLSCMCILLWVFFLESPSLFLMYQCKPEWYQLFLKCEISINSSAFASAQLWNQFFNGVSNFSAMILGF